MGNQIILDFLSDDEPRSCAGVRAALKRIFGALGFPYFAVFRRARLDAAIPEYLLAGEFPAEWGRIYDEKSYAYVSPTRRFLTKTQDAFRWCDAFAFFRDDPIYPKMRRMMRDSARAGLEDGYVFPVHCRRGLVGYLSVGGPPIELSALERALIEAVAKKAFWMLIEARAPELAQELRAPVDFQLTRREMEALSYLTDGMTSNEISQVLNISSNTVDWYMNGIQSKLRAKNRHHAVAIAFRNGLIS